MQLIFSFLDPKLVARRDKVFSQALIMAISAFSTQLRCALAGTFNNMKVKLHILLFILQQISGKIFTNAVILGQMCLVELMRFKWRFSEMQLSILPRIPGLKTFFYITFFLLNKVTENETKHHMTQLLPNQI